MKKNYFIIISFLWSLFFAFLPVFLIFFVKSLDFILVFRYYLFIFPISFLLLLVYYFFFWRKKNGGIRFFFMAHVLTFLILCVAIAYWMGGVLGGTANIVPVF